MKAARISEYGGPEVISIEEIAEPGIEPHQVLVEVHAASINPFDGKIRSGAMKDYIPLTLPVTLGGDIAGVVKQVGSDVTGFAIGDEVYGQANAVSGSSGGFAEVAAAAAANLSTKPSNVSFEEAASLVLVGASALQAINEHIKLQPGQKLFVHGGAGGIGTVAIQVAKQIGAHVATTATGSGVDLVKALGVDEVIDYKTEDFSTKLAEYDAVFDTVGGDDFAKSLGILKKGGIAVTMAAQVDEATASELGVTAIAQMTATTTEVLDELRALVETGVVAAQIDKTFSLDQIADAFRAKEEGSVNGKVVIAVAEE